jgi:two-component system, NarL family, sensor histidine kinase FusK
MPPIAYAEHAQLQTPQGVSPRVRPPALLRDPPWRYLVGLGSLVALYYGAAHLGYAFEFAGPVAAIVWLPVGVGIAFLYLGGLSYWPGILAGDLLVNNYSALPVGSALGQSAGNVLEVLVASALLRRLCPRGSTVSSVSSLAKALVSVAAGTALSATIGAASLRLGGVISSGGIPHVWRTWWLGDFSGALIVLPLALAWSVPPPRPWRARRVLEGAGMLATVAILSDVAFHTRRPLDYVVFPALIWAALRFGPRGATLAVVVNAGFALWGTTHYAGPFASDPVNRSVLDAQLYLAVAALSTLFLAALVSERKQLADVVAASRSRLIETADAERRRLERDLHDGAQQGLLALAARLALARAQAREEPARTDDLLADAEAASLVVLEQLRKVAHGIRPPMLEEFGLRQAVQGALGQTVVPVDLTGVLESRMDDTAEATAYYVVLEAVTNAQRHARASEIQVRAELERELRLEICDDGRGGAIERPGGGLQGLRDRVEATGGRFTIHSTVGHGTCVLASIPATERLRTWT